MIFKELAQWNRGVGSKGGKLLSLVKRRSYDTLERSSGSEGTLVRYEKEEIPKEMDARDFAYVPFRGQVWR